jgi:penicillin-binding protein 1B
VKVPAVRFTTCCPNLTLAGKTGTSNDSRDSWFAGFSQDLLAVVWLGRDDNGKTPFTGATGALQVWTSFMRKADPLPLDMPQPDNIVQAWIDPHTGQGSDANCPGAVQMPYIRGSEPPPGAACGGALLGGVGDGLGQGLDELSKEGFK